MAIHGLNNGADNQQAQTQTGTFSAQLNQQSQQQASGLKSSNVLGGGRLNLFTGRMFGSSMSKVRGSNDVRELADLLTEIYARSIDDANIQVEVLPVDRSGTSLLFGGVIVAVKSIEVDAPVYYHTLILSSSGEELRPRIMSTQGVGGVVDYEVVYTVPQVWDEEYVRVTKSIVRRAFPKAGEIRQVDATVIPAEGLDLTDIKALYPIAFNACLACGTEMTVRSEGFKDLNVKEIIGSNQANVSVSFNNNQLLKDIVGRPIKSDILISYSLTRKSQQAQPGQYTSLNKIATDKEAGVLSAYIDLIWSFEGMPFNGMINNRAFYGAQQQIPYLYTPNLVITGVETNFSMSPAGVLLTLVNALSIEQNGYWKQYFKPVDTSKGQVDIHDLGYIGYELIPHIKNFGGSVSEDVLKGGNSYIDLKSDTVGLEMLYGIINMAMSPQIFVSLDVPDAAPNSWALSMFKDASDGSTEATQAIIDAANHLTDGIFSQYYKSGEMFFNPGNRIHMGYYKDGSGVMQDIRDVTYLAALALSKGDVNLVRDFSETYNRTSFDINLRLSSRKKMIQAWTGDTAVITGYATRVTFSKDFIYALTAACNAAGYLPRMQSAVNQYQGNVRSVPTYLQNVLIDNNQFRASVGQMSQGINTSGQLFAQHPNRFA